MPTPVDRALAALEPLARGAPSRRLEWSLRVERDRVSWGDRFTVWLDGAGQLERVGEALAERGMPREVLDHRASVAERIVSQGLHLSPSADGHAWRLYLHLRGDAGHPARYEGWSWSGSGGAECVTYAVCRLPSADVVDPVLVRCLDTLGGWHRLAERSAVWLRSRRGRVDQTYVALPWHPALRDLHGPLRELCTSLGLRSDWIGEFADHGLRFLGFRSLADGQFGLSIYFSARHGGPAADVRWPRSHDELRTQVLVATARLRSRAAPIYFAAQPHAFDRSMIGRLPEMRSGSPLFPFSLLGIPT